MQALHTDELVAPAKDSNGKPKFIFSGLILCCSLKNAKGCKSKMGMEISMAETVELIGTK